MEEPSLFNLLPVDQFFVDFSQVVGHTVGQLHTFLNRIYRMNNFNFIFYAAMLPSVLMIAFDVFMSFVLSIRHREIRFFNMFSSRSWAALRSNYHQGVSDAKNYPRENSLKYLRISSLGVSVLARAGIIKPKSKKIVKYNSDGKLVVSEIPSNRYSTNEHKKLHNEFLNKYPMASEYECGYSVTSDEHREMSKKHPSINIEADDIE